MQFWLHNNYCLNTSGSFSYGDGLISEHHTLGLHKLINLIKLNFKASEYVNFLL